LVAREIHKHSPRSERPLIRVNCASIPRELYEREFFGHARGSFTGALRDRAGRFEAANGGALLLDEVGEIPLELQSKFLRVLQEGQHERVGEERTRNVDVRIIAAAPPQARSAPAGTGILRDLEFRQREREDVLAALNKTGWKIHGPGGAAELLGLKPTTLIARVKKFGFIKEVHGALPASPATPPI
jgi:transcriptional regulator with GAF, ATPase, and Fis domain